MTENTYEKIRNAISVALKQTEYAPYKQSADNALFVRDKDGNEFVILVQQLTK